MLKSLISSSSLGDTEGILMINVAMLIRSPHEKNQAEERRLAQARITNLASDLH